MYNYILVNGYFATGASAVVDYLKEFEGVFTSDCEFRILKDPHGVIDLDNILNGNNDVLNEDMAMREFLLFAKKYIKKGGKFRPFGLGYENYYGKNFYKITENYINSLTDSKYRGHWWYIDILDAYPKFILHKILRKFKIYDDRRKSFMYFRNKDELDFLEKTRNYINQIFDDLFSNEKKNDYIVLEQAVAANQPGLAQRYFPGSKVIVVDRDPRSVYYESNTRLSSTLGQMGQYVNNTKNYSLFVDYYKKCRQESKYKGDCFRIQFENFVLDRNDIRKKLLEYVGITEDKHIRKEEFFKPNVSIKNIDVWKHYDYDDAYRFLEKELTDYLYNY